MRTSGVIIYKRVVDELVDDIASGKLEPGAQLPPEQDLSARFSVHRHTLRRAISVLSDMGLVTVEHGRGTFVTAGALNYPVARRTRFTEVISRQNLTPSSTVLRTAIVSAKSQLAADLQVGDGTPCIMIDMLRYASGLPVSLASHYFVQARFPTLIDAIESKGSLSRALKECGVEEYFRKTTRVSARSATMEEAKLLRQTPSKPVLVSETVNVDKDNGPIEYGVIRSACERLQLVFET
ncbi:phosphonate metabolism transcriptional regulator PhnF [Labrys wisconsinensis]|uniref:GntR family phosphonate transport system transcriptional regulator n=1 Tax=Labrys wisconsinensis TaxID=425677 RepID=A0ABU0JCQ1_9HYPH|nr:phosphonate metabolism transcriptional regulator PhnF [Labrys wisconsinensis]MDQ0472053.1 GntR family phosphonate transport system transcriptional regulator [Labrys wisconsinensis]